MENSTIGFYRSDSQLMNDAIDRIVVQVHNNKKKLDKKMILLTGCGPTNGVTTLAINLAIALSLSGWKTLLVDSDLRKGSKYKRLGKETKRGLGDYLAKNASKEEIINKTNYELLEYISCGKADSSAVRLLCSAEMNSLMESIKQEYDYIIFDSPSVNIVSDANILFPNVDGIVLVAALNYTTKRQLWDAKRHVDKYGDKYYGLIINQVDMDQYGSHILDYDYFKKNNMDKKYQRDMKQAKKRKKRNSNSQEDLHE